ncbi:TPA: glycosyltransferase [Vibrio cholerae]|uniref:glycosyltransferase n=1 Tax=Vibrio cholerae TaxID=666 RepID=UPI0011DC1D05|nr:glycosyltransferase [Vibrio cholerae]EJL8259182.1 glycosyltransferase [Vibrio cholerae]TXZ05412.1 glycosyltransferase family 4 protein [Vibrio cholerae]HDZ3771272.1 glycosyltransferase [Vibrio cholerae]
MANEMNNKKIRVAFPTSGFMYWNGGLDFLKNIVYAYASYCQKNNKPVEIYIILPRAGFVNRLKNAVKKILGKSVVDEGKILEYYNDIQGVNYIFSDYDIESQAHTAESIDADLLFPCFYPIKKSQISWIGYLFDCQHIGLPENFSAAEIRDRNRDFQAMIDHAKTLVVNSIDTRNDLQQYFDTKGCDINSFPFCPTLKSDWKKFIQSERTFNEQYFIVCNQFWKHKNHITVFKAFVEYCKNGGKSNLVCTGALEDYRNESYYKELKEFIDSSEYKSRIIITGYIEKSKQIELLYNSIALIQPTLFEGGPGGGAVYDAVALGKPVIMSDIKINFEVEWDKKTYFPKLDSSSLAKIMTDFDTKPTDNRMKFEDLEARSDKQKDALGSYINKLVLNSLNLG